MWPIFVPLALVLAVILWWEVHERRATARQWTQYEADVIRMHRDKRDWEARHGQHKRKCPDGLPCPPRPGYPPIPIDGG